MRATGIIRKTDDLGRFVIPKELRKSYGIGSRDSVEIFTVPEGIVVRKYVPSCVFCGKYAEDTKVYHGIRVCKKCADNLFHEFHAGKPEGEH